jgi:hypothetical protein
MNWIFLILTSLAIYTVYNIVVLRVLGIPKSLSMTFYLFKEKRKWLCIWFPIMMVSCAFLLLPSWLELSEGSPFQFLSFFAPIGIIFTGTAPAFKSSKLENAVHLISAIFAAAMALLWIILVAKMWYIIVIWTIIIALIAFITKTYKSSVTYWLEQIAFMSTFHTLCYLL